MDKQLIWVLMSIGALQFALGAAPAYADGDLQNVNHIIIVMQENHSFDNYFGALAYDSNGPYHNGNGACKKNDHSCVDGLTCTTGGGGLSCSNVNLEDDGAAPVFAFHNTQRCVAPDLDHEWAGSHYEANFANPNNALTQPLNDGFVRQNDRSSFGQQDPPETGSPAPDDQTMGFYTRDEIPFYYDLAERFAIDDRYFSPVLGATFSNRAYLMAATSFGHLDGAETVMLAPGTCSIFGCPVPYKPITGTIFDLLDRFGVSWADYWSDFPQSVSFVALSELATQAKTIDQFFLDAAAGDLPQVAFVESAQGVAGIATETDEHPPTDIQRGQHFVSEVVNAVRSSPNWHDSILFITYDEAGGFYDHAAPPRARQGGASTPDGIGPGQCADLSNPPGSTTLGGGADCSASLADAQEICPSLDPTKPVPRGCSNFNQYGFRVPFIAVSPFSKPH